MMMDGHMMSPWGWICIGDVQQGGNFAGPDVGEGHERCRFQLARRWRSIWEAVEVARSSRFSGTKTDGSSVA